MTKYVVHYELRQGSKHAVYTKTVECESERTAIDIAEAKGQKDKPGYDFLLKKVEKK
jgi:hypothetical protein